jgi:hypothetical protein
LCKADFKIVAQPNAVFRQDMQENVANRPVHYQDIVMPVVQPGSPPRRQRRYAVEHDDSEEPPALPPRHLGDAMAGPGPMSLSTVSAPPPPPRSRRNLAAASTAGVDDATAASSISIRQLGEVSGGSALQPGRVRLPSLQARNGSAAALSPSFSPSAAYNSGPLEVTPSRGQRAGPRDRLDQA